MLAPRAVLRSWLMSNDVTVLEMGQHQGCSGDAAFFAYKREASAGAAARPGSREA